MSKATDKPHVWMVAAENGALPGGKVGGVGDVIRDLPVALVSRGIKVRVITPAYGKLHKLPEARFHRRLSFSFGGRTCRAAIYRLNPQPDGPETFVIEHQLMTAQRPGQVYISDPPDRPYLADSTRFAFLGTAVAAWIESARKRPDVVHLHDWHAALVALLRRQSPRSSALAATRLVFTIHNLAYQGIRPLTGEGSLAEWLPGMETLESVVGDPRYPGCVNFMATAVRLADHLTTVSPTYAREILLPNDPARGFHGGEGLQHELQAAHDQGRLTGVLNGCTYPGRGGGQPKWNTVITRLKAEQKLLDKSAGALAWLQRYRTRRPDNVLLSIGRITGQKSSLFLQPVDAHRTALDAILERCGDRAAFIMLGSGDPDMESEFSAIARRQPAFLFLRGFAESLSDLLYRTGDLFVMPSSFEPCGISQMLAMRAGQPCVVHAVGGLADTVKDGVTGFSFIGGEPEDQARNLVETVDRAMRVHRDEPSRWSAICRAAADARFSWDLAAQAYVEKIYRVAP